MQPTSPTTYRATYRAAAQAPSESMLGYVGLTVGSMLLSAGLRVASKRFGLSRFIGFVGPAVLLYSFYRRFSKQESSQTSENFLH
jgi:hypothetical protein